MALKIFSDLLLTSPLSSATNLKDKGFLITKEGIFSDKTKMILAVDFLKHFKNKASPRPCLVLSPTRICWYIWYYISPQGQLFGIKPKVESAHDLYINLLQH
jgi:hypothetical protein